MSLSEIFKFMKSADDLVALGNHGSKLAAIIEKKREAYGVDDVKFTDLETESDTEVAGMVQEARDVLKVFLPDIAEKLSDYRVQEYLDKFEDAYYPLDEIYEMYHEDKDHPGLEPAKGS